MKNAANILTGGGRVVILLGLIVLIGCGDAEKREAGKHLRDATEQARRLYNQALNILSSPSRDPSTPVDSLDPQALELLDQAKKILLSSLAKNYDALRGGSRQTPDADAGLAKMMLGLIDRLRAQYHIWDFDHTIARTNDVTGDLLRRLDQAQIRNALLSMSETYATLSETAVQKAIQETEQSKTKLDKTVAGFRKDIQGREGQIAEHRKNVETMSSRASSLRTEKTLARGAESQKKLNEALKIESEITRRQNEIQRIEGELIHLRALLAAEEIRQSEADAKIAALKEIQTRRGSDAEEVARSIEERKEDLIAACKDAAAAAAELDALAIQAAEQVRQADAALRQAAEVMEGAANLLDADKQAGALAELAHIKASEGALHRAVVSLCLLLKDSTDRLGHVWEGLHDAKPAQPKTPDIAAFLKASGQATETSLAAYGKALEYWERAARTADRENQWQYKRELVVGMLDYAAALDSADRAAEAGEFRKKARDYFTEIESAATRARKPRSIVALREYVFSETGS
ncbi:MAG: hypothetical protein JW849_11275 [Phycisphaerae bacterium]|nr:hypothetical protein [Phycisphaerae bacterium]